MKRLPISFALITSLLFVNFCFAQESLPVAKYLSTITAPEPIMRISPKYPINAAKQRREGWAIFSFVIDEEGKVQDVIVKDSSGSIDMTKAAKKAVKQWQYKPALVNGKPIQQCVNTVQMSFKMNKNGTTGVYKKFRSKYKSAIAALENKDYKEVERLLTLMKKNKYMHLSENNYMHLLAADYAADLGDKEQRLFHLSKAAINAVTRNEEQQMAVLYQVFILEVELQKYQAAYETYEKLTALEVAKPYITKLEKVITQINDAISGDKNIVIAANLDDSDHWSTALVRNEFSLSNIEGSLHTLDVRCANKRHQYTVENNNTWTIPSTWEDCSIYVYGEKNTRFNLIEHPLRG